MSTGYRGILVVDKERGPTSHDVVAAVRRLFTLRRVGHCGTLDPLASGVLVLCLGSFTRLNPWLSAAEKEYLSTFHLGARSDTGDAQGRIEPSPGSAAPPCRAVRECLRRFVGHIEQVPPAYSALKVKGVRSYTLARRDQAQPLPARRVHIAELELRHYAYPHLEVRLLCSRGTYVRSVASDVGAQLGCGAYVETLRRLRVGPLDLSCAFSLDQLAEKAASGRLDSCLVPPERALSGLPAQRLEDSQVEAFVHGASVRLEREVPARPEERAVYDRKEHFLGIGRWDDREGILRPLKVMASALCTSL